MNSLILPIGLFLYEAPNAWAASSIIGITLILIGIYIGRKNQ